ncbi:MAG TPA: hypothetical protein VL523_19505 [Terriglobia bacterium]|nr:hypothetical protein [Terriglobia bacterium]
MTQSCGHGAAKLLLFVVVPLLLALAPFASAAPPPSQDEGKDQGSSLVLKTPSAGLEVSGKVKASQIGLPVYPGARDITGKDRGNLAFNLSRQGKPDAKLLVAKFETADSAAQVRDYYKSKLGGKVTKFTEDSSDGSMSFEMKADNQHGRYVQIKPAEGKTEIDLVRIEGMDLSDSSK